MRKTTCEFETVIFHGNMESHKLYDFILSLQENLGNIGNTHDVMQQEFEIKPFFTDSDILWIFISQLFKMIQKRPFMTSRIFSFLEHIIKNKQINSHNQIQATIKSFLLDHNVEFPQFCDFFFQSNIISTAYKYNLLPAKSIAEFRKYLFQSDNKQQSTILSKALENRYFFPFQQQTISEVVYNDDIDHLQQISIEPSFDFDQKITLPWIQKSYPIQEATSIIQLAAFFHSIRCFKFLTLNECDDNDISWFAVFGGESEIIRICEQNSIHFDAKCVAAAVISNRIDILEWLLNTHIDISTLNIENLLFQSMTFDSCSVFPFLLAKLTDINVKKKIFFSTRHKTGSSAKANKIIICQ